jgi:hypothetical protein
MQKHEARDFQHAALHFTQALCQRDYAAAYDMTSRDYREQFSAEKLQSAFEGCVPPDWELGELEVGQTLEAWPDKQPHDVGWAYVSIGGDIYSEAVTVVARENGRLVIRQVEFGRP